MSAGIHQFDVPAWEAIQRRAAEEFLVDRARTLKVEWDLTSRDMKQFKADLERALLTSSDARAATRHAANIGLLRPSYRLLLFRMKVLRGRLP